MREWGTGDRVAVLLHGMAGSSRSWWQVGPRLAAQGWRVLAVDLPGHGDSAADPNATASSCVEAIRRTVPARIGLAIGHSMGGSLMARGVADGRLNVAAAVYVEAPFATSATSETREEIRERYARVKAMRTADWLRRNRPTWSAGDVEAEADAALRWDVDTAASLSAAAQGRTIAMLPRQPSLIIRADPNDVIDRAEAARLADCGFAIADVPDAGHTVWYGRVDEFVNIIERGVGVVE